MQITTNCCCKFKQHNITLQPIQPSTIDLWLKKIMQDVDVDRGAFSVHSLKPCCRHENEPLKLSC